MRERLLPVCITQLGMLEVQNQQTSVSPSSTIIHHHRIFTLMGGDDQTILLRALL
jgi:hypothetical protein